MYFFGVDVHQDSYTIACLDDKLFVVDVSNSNIKELVERVKKYEPTYIGVDGPYGLNIGLMDDESYRRAIVIEKPGHTNKKVSEYELSRRNIQAFSTPGSMNEITGWKTWMKSGFELYLSIEEVGYKKINEHNYSSVDKGLVEVFPHASFVTLLGYIPSKKNTQEGLADRIRILKEVGIDNILKWLPSGIKEKTDCLDAICAAYTAYCIFTGTVTFIGDKTEGQIALPTKKIEEKYSYKKRSEELYQNVLTNVAYNNAEYSYENLDSVIWLKRMKSINDSPDIYRLLDLKNNPNLKIKMVITNELDEFIEVVFERMKNRFDGIKPCRQYKGVLKAFWGSNGDRKNYIIRVTK